MHWYDLTRATMFTKKSVQNTECRRKYRVVNVSNTKMLFSNSIFFMTMSVLGWY